MGSLLFPLLILAAGLAAYAPSFSGQFLLDDIYTIAQNPNLRHLWPFHPAWFIHPLEFFTYRPVIRFSLALNYAWGGTDVWGYHAFNLSVHLLAAGILFGLLRRTFGTEKLRSRYGRAADRLAFAIALLWAVHPLNTQAVTYVNQRAESLMGLFYLTTLYGWVRSVQGGRAGWGWTSIAACALGMATKPAMVTAPLAVLLYDRTFLAGSFRETWRQRRRFYVPLAGSWLVLVLLFWVEPPIRTGGFHFPNFTFWQNLATQCGVLIHYLRLSFWTPPPVLDYAWPPAKTILDIPPAGWLIPLGLAGSLWALQRQPPLGFLGIWFFLAQAPPTLVVMPLETAAEHRMYLPLISVIAAAVLAANRLLTRRWSALLLLAVFLPLATQTFLRNRMYQDPVRMWRETTLRRPQNPIAHFNLGVVLLRAKRFPEAAAAFRRATELMPVFPDAYWNWGFALEKQGEHEQAESLKALAQSQWKR